MADVVQALAVLPGGDVIAGGAFNNAGGVPVGHIARYNPRTGAWSGLSGGGTDGDVHALAVLPDGDLILAGFFRWAGGVPANFIARHNPSTGAWSPLGMGMNEDIYALAVLPGGDIVAGGNFTTAGGVLASRIARYNLSTGVWSPLGLGVSSPVLALTALPDGSVIAGGYFNTAGSLEPETARQIAHYNPSTGVWSRLATGMNRHVSALAVLPGGDLIAGGCFSTAGGMAANGIARYHTSTGVWSAFDSGMNHCVESLAFLPGGDVVVGGRFTTAGGVYSGRFARYASAIPIPTILQQPSPQTACPAGAPALSVAATGPGPCTYQWQIQAAPNTWTTLGNDPFPLPCGGGAFAYATPLNSPTVTIGIHPCPGSPTAPQHFQVRAIVTNACASVTSNEATYTICPADINCSGSLSVQDIFDFLAAYFSGQPSGDFNQSGTTSVQDIFDFLAAYFAGC
jgi:hypothetical protein